jgi:(1->4)-alpha-D-glucan 1-alpha-D-glucosylmutase
LNEVGGDPGEFGIEAERFHARNKHRANVWPQTLLATATHDTKRGEDLRARLNVLSEMPVQWREATARWRDWNARFKTSFSGKTAPDANDEYLLYQTIAGMWDIRESVEQRAERLSAYVLKAARESKHNTSWIEPNKQYETGLADFTHAILDPRRSDKFLDDVVRVARELAFFGAFNSISQTVLKLTCPGVPDIYQGCELLDLSLVDPDNRRPVDYSLCKRLLEWVRARAEDGIHPGAGRELMEQVDGAAKLFVIWRLLNGRTEHHRLFDSGNYKPIAARGVHGEHVCAFSRSNGDEIVVVAVPRLIRTLLRGERICPFGKSVWQDTELELPEELRHRKFTNVLTCAPVAVNGQGLHIGELFNGFPAAVLAG